MALADGGFLMERFKKKWFDKRVSNTTILVTFTTIDVGDVLGQAAEGEEGEVINIRKFRSVAQFMERVRSLDTVLENIESFSNQVRQLQGLEEMTPGTDNANE